MRRNWVLGSLAVTLMVGVALFFGQRWIGERVFSAAVEERAGIDRSEALADGLHVYVCGSGSPMADAERAGPCLAVLAGRQGFIFDTGSGSPRKLGAMGFPMDRLEALFLTHLHSDHLDGLGELMLQAWMGGGRAAPLPVYGPQGTERVVAGFMQAYEIDRGYRIEHHGPEVARPAGFGGEARIVDGNSQFDFGDVTISALAVDHAPVENALAFRIEYQGRAIVISGDTKSSQRLAEFSRGADILLHEALNPQMVAKIGTALANRGNMDGAKIMADIPDYHTSPEGAARIAQTAGVKALILYHLVPAPPAQLVESVFLADAPDRFDGRIELAEDGLLISLPAASREIEFDQLL